MYSATVQLSLNGSEPSWSSNGWSLVPKDLSTLSGSELHQHGCGNDTACVSAQSFNVTVPTSAVRARLQCTPYEFLDETALWLTEWNLTDEAYWKVSENPRMIDHGYELGKMFDSCSTSLFLDSHEELLANAGNYNGSWAPSSMTPFFVDIDQLICCQNVSSDNQIHSASIGYWSPNIRCDSLYVYPYIAETWPSNFTIKWIRGKPIEGYRRNTTLSNDIGLIWAEPPQMTAMSCRPIIEKANTSVTVEAPSGRVIDLRILDEPQPDTAAWSDNFAVHQYYPSTDFAHNMPGWANITVSYGVLFMTALLGAANIANFEVNGRSAYQGIFHENLHDQAFNMRGPGLNVDYMSYAMLSLVNGSHDALLDPNVLESTAQRVFEVMFQHFAHGDLDMKTGGNVYQNSSETLPVDMDGPTATIASKANGRRQQLGFETFPSTINSTYVPDTVGVEVKREVEILRMSTTAAIICMGIVAYLIVTSLVLVIAARRYNKLLPSEINSVADVAVLVAGSDRLLQLAREGGDHHGRQLKRDPRSLAKLGWFKEAGGELRWGIELVEAKNKAPPTVQRGM